MATLGSAPKPGGHGRAMEELDHLLQDLYVANTEENRLIEKEKQHIQALEAAYHERQKLIQNYEQKTSQTDKDIKFAHQQFKHNRANCESMKSHYGVLQQHLANMYKKQEDSNNKWKDKRTDLSRRVDQYEGTWQTYQAKYEESELARQLLDLESQVTLINNRIGKTEKTKEQLRHSIAQLQKLDTNENQTFESLNAFIIRIAEVKNASNKFMKEIGDKQVKIEKLQQLGQGLQQQEKQLHQQLEEAQAAKQEQERVRKEKERLEAEKVKKSEEQAVRQREIAAQSIQSKPTYRNSTPGTSSINNNLIQRSTSISSNASIGSVSRYNTSHGIVSNAAPSQPTPAQHKSPPFIQFIQMPLLSSTSSSSMPAQQQAKLTTSLGVEKGAKTTTAPPQFSLQIPVLPQQQQQKSMTSQASTITPQIVISPPPPPVISPPKAVTVATHQQQLLVPPHQPIQEPASYPTKQPQTITRLTPPPQVVPAVSYAGGDAITHSAQTPGTRKQAAGNNMGIPISEVYQQQQQQQQQQQAGAAPLSYDLPLPAEDNGLNMTPDRGYFQSHRANIEASNRQSPGFVLPSRPMFQHQANPQESEAMESTSSSNNFQDFSSIFAGNSFSSSNNNAPQMFASPTASNTNDKRNTESSDKSFGGFMMPSSSNSMRTDFNNPADMFGNPASPQLPNSCSGGALSMFGGGGGDASGGNGPGSPAGFSFSFGGSGATNSPKLDASSSQPFSLF